MPLISLETGLVVRRGARTLEFVRLLEGNKVQFQDQLTGQIQNMHLARFYSGVLAKQLIPVLHPEPASADIAAKPPVFVQDISSLKENVRVPLRRRMAYVRAMRRKGITRGQREKIAEEIPRIAKRLKDKKPPPSASTVMDWMRKFDHSGGSPASQISGNAHRRRSPRICDLVREVVIRKLRSVYLTRARHTLKHTMDHIRKELGSLVEAGKLAADKAKVSDSSVHRTLKTEFDPYAVAKARYGVDHARATFRTSVEGGQAIRPLQRLECDHTLLNWVVICDRTGLPLGRPTLTIIVDSFSGYVVGIYVSFYGPGLTSVLNVLKNAILPKDEMAKAAGCKRPWLAFGIGETLLLDNGLEFHSPQFQLAAWELGIDLEYCRVRTPWLKPRVERFFLNLDFLALSKGRVHKPMDHVLNIDPKKDAAITFSDFLRGLIKFVVDVYPFEENSRTLEMPFEKYKGGIDELPPPLFPTSFEQLDMIAAMSKTLTVGPGGVELLGVPYSSSDLMVLKKTVASRFKTLVKWNPDDLAFLYVQHPRDGMWLPVPTLWPEYANGLSWIQHRLIRKHAKEKRVAGGYEEALLAARLELYEIWTNPIVRAQRKLDPKDLGRFSGASSTTAFGETDDVARVLPAAKVVAKEEVTPMKSEDIPDYESFEMA